MFLKSLTNEFYKGCWELRRYWLDALVSYVFLAFLLVTILFGYRFASADSIDPSKTKFIVQCFFLWVCSSEVYMSVNRTMSQEIGMGTLAPAVLNSGSLIKLLAMRAIVDFTVKTLPSLTLLVLASHAAGISLLSSGFSLAVLLASLVSVFGFGAIFAGITLYFKRTTSIVGLVNFLLGIVCSISVESAWAKVFLPFAWGSSLWRSQIAMDSFSYSSLLWLVLNAFFYLGWGFLSLIIFERAARRHNIFQGHHG